jgi:selenocysteine-specific elongation factor
LQRETLRERQFSHSPSEVFRGVLNNLEQQGVIVAEKDLVRLREHTLTVSDEDVMLRDKLAKSYREARLEPPSIEEACANAGIAKSQLAHGRKLLQLLIDSGELVRIQPDLLFDRATVNDLTIKLREYAAANEPDRLIDVASFKTLAGVSRKYAIPLLEYFDRERITRRAGDRRLILR